MTTATQAPPLTCTIAAPAAQVYQALTDVDWIKDWWSDNAALNAEADGYLLVSWYGGSREIYTIDVLEDNQRVVLVNLETGARLDFQIEGDAHQATLSLIIDGPEALYATWGKRLDALQAALESGEDRRLTGRIIVGIYPAHMDTEWAAEHGVPVDYGLRVGGLVEGFSASEAGIQIDDVIISVAGQLMEGVTVQNLVYDNEPGDVVAVQFYRGPELYTVQATLHGYPVPEVPADFVALAARVEEDYATLYEQLTALFVGSSPDQAAHNAAEGEWSANEVLAHLILHERYAQNWLGGLMQGPEIGGYTCNAQARIDGITATFPTRDVLLAELRRAQQETVMVLRHFPAELATRKTSLWWASFEFTAWNHHTRSHFDQIRMALANAQQ